jgi:hypothetical protein
MRVKLAFLHGSQLSGNIAQDRRQIAFLPRRFISSSISSALVTDFFLTFSIESWHH